MGKNPIQSRAWFIKTLSYANLREIQAGVVAYANFLTLLESHEVDFLNFVAEVI